MFKGISKFEGNFLQTSQFDRGQIYIVVVRIYKIVKPKSLIKRNSRNSWWQLLRIFPMEYIWFNHFK